MIKSRSIARATIAALLLGVAPVASAVGQESNQPPAPQQVIGATVNGQPVMQPASLNPAPAAEPVDAPSIVSIAAAQEVDVLRARIEAEEKEAAEIEAEAAALKPGKFMWKADRSESGEVEIVVSISEQKAYVYRGDKLIAVSTVSTGKKGHRTPTGSFTILQKNRRHFSNLYNNAPMPNMQRLTWGGIALHAGQLPGYPASHGCVRLPMEFSKLLFGITKLGGRVHIVADAPPSAAGALAFATGGARGVQMASAR